MKTLLWCAGAFFGVAPFIGQSVLAQPAGGVAKTEGKEAKAAKEAKPKGVAYLRFLHAVADAPAADVYLDGKKVAENVAFKTLSDYLKIDSGKTAIKLTAAGKADVLAEDTMTAGRDGYFTVAAYGTKEKVLVTSQNDLTGKIEDQKARIRVFHLSPGAPPVDITTPSTRAKDGAADLIKNVEFGKDATKLMEPGKITLQVRADGKVIKEATGVTLEAGRRYAVFAIGKAGAAGAEAFDMLVKPAGP